jgi:3-deoxy-D-manno-octulosonate 8-phosphate phosphatase KdsC-like HAD superfamily phosphatase
MGEPHKHCFAYCGDDRCDCPAREAFGLLGRVSTALPVLSTMLHKIGATGGARLASEMHAEAAALADTKGDRPMGDR